MTENGEAVQQEESRPAIQIVFESVHSTSASMAYSAAGVDVGQLIIARDMLGREIESFYRKIELMEATRPQKGIVVPGLPGVTPLRRS